ncbi:MAG: hypothetical protein ABR599_11800, partial [Gemmatimonadota bacterium]
AQAALRRARAERDRLSEERLRVGEERARALADREAATRRKGELEAALAALGGSAEADEGPDAEEGGELELDARIAELRAARADGETVAAGRGHAREEAERALVAVEGEHAELEARRREAAARLDTLEELKEGFAGFGEGARRVLEERGRVAPGLRGPLGLEVEVEDPFHAPAVEAYLDLVLDAVLTRDVREARAVLEFWRECGQAGAVWPLAHTAAGAAPELQAATRERVLCRGAEAARLRGDLDAHREALLGRLLIVEDLERALELRGLLNGDGATGGWVVATLTGEILEPSGIVRRPQRESEREAVSRFHQAELLRTEIERLTVEGERAGTRITELRARGEEAAAAARAADAELAARAAELDRAERELERVRAARSAARDRATEIARDLGAVRKRAERDTKLAEEAAAQADAIVQGLEEAEAAHAAAEAELERVRVEREEALREHGGRELAAEQRAAALSSLQRETRWLEDAALEQERLATAKEAELRSQAERVTRLEDEGARASAVLADRRLGAQARRSAHRAHEADIARLEGERASRNAAAAAARAAHEEAARELHLDEMRLSDLLHRRESIRSILETEFGRPFEELSAQARQPVLDAESGGDADQPEDTSEPALEALRERLREVREKKTALGPVNLLALEEFQSEKERLDFLESQVDDLQRAREGLREAIRKINATARELFTQTFEAMRVNFRATFGTLFEGGTAEISLADPADPLESEIEISASPRGKRVQAVNLLSGGEKALTALSLLFAIYLVKPSPFCILDEVDAPLDDANIGRFLRMLKTFSDRTQFIVVTHNKRTMEASDYLYGVTMEEPGVSTLVSVDFDRRHAFDPDALRFPRHAREAEGLLVGD